MTYRTRRTTFLQQLTIIARRAHRWAMVKPLTVPTYRAITRHIGRAY